MFFFFFNDTATTEIYTLSLHDALPIWNGRLGRWRGRIRRDLWAPHELSGGDRVLRGRSEEHTSELQSRQYLVCRLLLEKKQPTSGTALGGASAVKPRALSGLRVRNVES